MNYLKNGINKNFFVKFEMRPNNFHIFVIQCNKVSCKKFIEKLLVPFVKNYGEMCTLSRRIENRTIARTSIY